MQFCTDCLTSPLRLLVEQLPGPAAYREGDSLFVNRAAEQLTGHAAADLATPDAWFAALHGHEAAAARVDYERDRAAGFPAPRELSFRRGDGQRRVAVVLRHRQEAGEVWLLHERQCAEQVRSARLTALERLTSHVAHSLRNPLGVIRNAVFLLQRLPVPQEPRFADYLKMIEREAVTTGRILADLQEVTRPRAPLRQEADLAALIRAALDRLPLPERVTARCSARPDPLPVEVDALQIGQLLDILIRNAVEAVAGAGAIAVDAWVEGETAVVAVSDTGPGVAPEHRASLFEPLFSTRPKGTGLGLYRARQIARQHGGDVEASAVDGRGLTVRARLPRPAAPPPEHQSGP